MPNKQKPATEKSKPRPFMERRKYLDEQIDGPARPKKKQSR